MKKELIDILCHSDLKLDIKEESKITIPPLHCEKCKETYHLDAKIQMLP